MSHRGLRARLGLSLKKTLAPLLYRHRPVGLSAGKLYLYLDALYRTRALTGAVVEIGCNVCGTASVASEMVRKLGSPRRYVCVDTFAGFVDEQLAEDVRRGNDGSRGAAFSINDIELARRVLELHGGHAVELVEADICQLDADSLPPSISVALIDVDLYQPVLAGLAKVYPRLEPGGAILVDDCHPPGGDTWQAGVAFSDFCAEHGIQGRLELGMGIVVKPAG